MRWFELHHWSPKDDALLRVYVCERGLSRRQIAIKMRKSCGSVCGRIFRLKLKLPPGIAAERQRAPLKLGAAAASAKRKEAAVVRRAELTATGMAA